MNTKREHCRYAVIIIVLLLLLLCLVLMNGGGTHRVTVVVEGGGYADPSGEIDVGNGDDLMIGLHPDEGFEVASVEVDGRDMYEGGNEVVLRDIREDHLVRVVFSSEPGVHVIEASSTGGGRVSPSGTIAVADGEDIGFLFEADEGSALSALYVDGVRVAVSDSYVFGAVSSDHTIHAVFSESEPGADPGGLEVNVTKVEGIRIGADGRAEMFRDPRVRPLSEGDPFDLDGMFPGMWQTATIEVLNGGGSDLRLYLHATDLRGSEELADGIAVIVRTGGSSQGIVLSDLLGTGIDLGRLPAGDSSTLKMTLELPGESSGNGTIDRSLSFRLSVEASK